mmetsp:Transcript_58223/g.129809  ORF Transcript_58223/g.129809 Transcript_58223/m.129809 type:complete len:112 (-) Transcript_58223:409-744(-)
MPQGALHHPQWHHPFESLVGVALAAEVAEAAAAVAAAVAPTEVGRSGEAVDFGSCIERSAVHAIYTCITGYCSTLILCSRQYHQCSAPSQGKATPPKNSTDPPAVCTERIV